MLMVRRSPVTGLACWPGPNSVSSRTPMARFDGFSIRARIAMIKIPSPNNSGVMFASITESWMKVEKASSGILRLLPIAHQCAHWDECAGNVGRGSERSAVPSGSGNAGWLPRFVGKRAAWSGHASLRAACERIRLCQMAQPYPALESPEGATVAPLWRTKQAETERYRSGIF